MKQVKTAIILAGGLGTRLAEETHLIPKPMVAIGGTPILMHLINYFVSFGVTNIYVCCGYKQEKIKEYFYNYYMFNSDISVDLGSGEVSLQDTKGLPVQIHLKNTGVYTMTGSRLKKMYQYVKDEENVFVTYGDGLSDVDLFKLTKAHCSAQKLATVTAVVPDARFGALVTEENLVIDFVEKPVDEGGRVNGGFFIIKPSVLNEFILPGEEEIFEDYTVKMLSSKRELNCYNHDGFWKAMDTLRDKEALETIWSSGKAPWIRPVDLEGKS